MSLRRQSLWDGTEQNHKHCGAEGGDGWYPVHTSANNP